MRCVREKGSTVSGGLGGARVERESTLPAFPEALSMGLEMKVLVPDAMMLMSHLAFSSSTSSHWKVKT